MIDSLSLGAVKKDFNQFKHVSTELKYNIKYSFVGHLPTK